MKLSEAMELGHTLIEEETTVYLESGCGCAIGSAGAAHGLTQFDEGVGEPWLRQTYPWTRRAVEDFANSAFGRVVRERIFIEVPDIAAAISSLHACSCTPRLEIARMLREIEPEEPTKVEAEAVEVEV